MKKREEIDVVYTWDLEAIYSSIDDFEVDYSKVRELIKKLAEYESVMMDNAVNFYETLRLSFEIERILDKLSSYTSLSFDLDTSDNKKQALSGKVSNLQDEYSKASYFIVPSMLSVDYNRLEEFYKEVPELKDYEVSIKNIYRYKDHTLGEKEEKILSSIGKMMGNNYDTYELFKDCDMSFGDIYDESGNKQELTNSNYSVFIESKDRSVRKSAFKTLYETYKKFANTFSSLLASNIKEDTTMAKLRNYNSAIEASLYADEVDISIYDNLISAVHENIDTIYDYYKLKKDALGLDELHLYDIYVPMTGEVSTKYDYDEAKEIILKVLEVFGKEYTDKVSEALSSRWIDVFPTRNKRTGGYSGGSYDTYPYILLNYQDKYNDMSTLIHEMGHSMHSYYSRVNNSYQNAYYRIFVAEVASTVNELLLSYYMLDHSESMDDKKAILNNLMELYRATIYRQTMFAEFEKIIYEKEESGETITSELLSDVYYDLNKFYFGENVVVDDEVRYEWERIPHFYYNFYVYKYATGLSAASIIVKNILNKKEGAVENYLEFLKCGSSKSPLESLKVAGVDLSDKSVINEALENFKEIIDEYKKMI